MKWRRSLITGIALALVLAAPARALADGDINVNPGGNPYDPEVWTGGVSSESGTTEVVSTGNTATSGNAGSLQSFEYEWVLSCFNNYPGMLNKLCPAARNCTGQNQFRWNLWARQVTDANGDPTPTARWLIVLAECYTGPPPAPEAAPQPQVTDALVLQAVRRLGLPRLTVQVQPSDETLVNFDTIFYAEPPTWARTVQLLGFTVDVEAAPTGYDWRFGDGETATTQTAGAPYPAKDITHAYTNAGVRVQPRVDTAYEIRYRVDRGGWQTIAETVPAAGLPVALRIREATPVLVGD